MFENYFVKKYHNIIVFFKSNNKHPNYASFSRNYS